jgi:hypothetical protein
MLRGVTRRGKLPFMVPEAPLESTEHGLVATGDGWFVLNAREARWHHGEGRGARLLFDGETYFPQVGISLFVLAPGEPIGRRRTAQEPSATNSSVAANS